MKCIVLVLTENGQKHVQVEIPNVDLNMLLSKCIESFKTYLFKK